jgi:hypothetical protein
MITPTFIYMYLYSDIITDRGGLLRIWFYLLYLYNWPLAKCLVHILKSTSVYHIVHLA